MRWRENLIPFGIAVLTLVFLVFLGKKVTANDPHIVVTSTEGLVMLFVIGTFGLKELLHVLATLISMVHPERGIHLEDKIGVREVLIVALCAFASIAILGAFEVMVPRAVGAPALMPNAHF